ncbi:MAG: hypothetical protein C0475_08845 [Planctomyces sp.]|nr:hypothetical protein [Planctomyces sp.]
MRQGVSVLGVSVAGVAAVLALAGLAGAAALGRGREVARAAGQPIGGLGIGTGGVARLWADNCAKCHGADGSGGNASSLLDDQWAGPNGSDRALYEAIHDGQADFGMPGYAETLRDEEVWALTVFVRELRQRAARADQTPPPADGLYASASVPFRVESVIGDGKLATPWSVDFLPDGAMLVTEKAGRLRMWRDGALSEPVQGTPAVRAAGQGGLMDVAVHPDYADNGWVYLAFSHGLARGGRSVGMTKLVRGKIAADGAGAVRWTQEEVVYQAPEETYLATNLHFGCRIVFDGAGHVLFGIGERGQMDHAQELGRPNGKIHRVREDGSVPNDNPFVGRDGALGSVWSYGHRNPQGLVMDAEGRLWDTEHGPRGGDELNLVRRGGNHGWPIVSFGINYTGSPFRTPWAGTGEVPAQRAAELVLPVTVWTPSVGVCGLDIVRGGARGEAFGAWRGDFVAGGLSGQSVDRVRLAQAGGAWSEVEREELIRGLGRVRDVVTGPEGAVYVVLNGPDSVIRLVPAGLPAGR